MHILFVVYDYNPGQQMGGVSVYVDIMAHAWSKAGHQVSVMARSDSGQREEFQDGDIRVIRVVPQKYPGAWKDKIKCRLYNDNSVRGIYLKEFSYAALQEMNSWNTSPTVIEGSTDVAWGFIQHSTIPYICRVHGINELARKADPDNAHIQARLIENIESFSMQNANILISPTDYLKQHISQHSPKKIHLIANPFDMPKIEWNGEKNHRQLVCVSRLIPGKGLESAIQILAKLDDTWKLMIVGPDSARGPHQSSMKAHLKELAVKLGVDKRVTFTGPLNREDTLLVIASSKALIHDSENDNMPYVILEALSLKTHVIASSVGGIPETVDELGICHQQGDIEAYTKTIQSLEECHLPNTQKISERHRPSIIQEQTEFLLKSYLENKS